MHTPPPNMVRRGRAAAERIDRLRDFATPPLGAQRLEALTAFARRKAEGGAPADC